MDVLFNTHLYVHAHVHFNENHPMSAGGGRQWPTFSGSLTRVHPAEIANHEGI